MTQSNLGYFSDKPRAVKSFCWQEDQWDLRAINPNFDQRDLENSTLNFSTIHPSWFKQAAKRYIQHLCKAGNTFGTIGLHLSALRIFSRYLNQTDVASFQQINRSLVLNYLVQEQKVTKNKLGG